MKNLIINKKSFIFSVGLFLFFSSVTYAIVIVPCGTSVSGQTDCTLSDLSLLFKNTLKVAFEMVAIFAVAMIVYTGFKLMTGKDKAAELSDSKERMWKVGTGIILFFAAPALIISILNSIGLSSEFLNMFKFFFPTAVLDSFSAHAYAATSADSALLPSPLEITNPLDFLALLLHLTITWLVFPCIILAWLRAGFLYVKAQGNPQELKDANSWLWWTLIGTVIIMLAETFYSVLRGTITSLIP